MASLFLHIPASIGELYDKISILEIKAERISDPEKLRFVHTELAALRSIALRHPINTELYVKLKEVNKVLWDIEDAIREEERKQSFGDVFIRLARSVYKSNDKRSEIKKEINLNSGSEVVEVKSYTPYN